MKRLGRLISVLLAAFIAVTAMCVSAGAATYSWTGTWSSDWGDMTLTQNGSKVTGTYTHDGGTISGTVSGNTLTGTWKEPGQVGKISWVMSSDGKSFNGKWGYNDDTPGNTWIGTRKTAVTYIDGGSTSGKASASLSNVKWNSSSKKLTFTVKFANVQSDAWVGIVPSGTADDEKSADKADLCYHYLSSLKSGAAASLSSSSIKSGNYELRVYANDNGGALLARAKFSVGSASNAALSYIQVEIKKGSSLQLSGILSDSTTGNVTWSTSKSSVAAVSSKGKVTAKSKGTAVVTAKYGGKSLGIRIKVTA